MQQYYLNIDDSKLTVIIRAIETNSLQKDEKVYLLNLLKEVIDQRVTEE